MTINRFIPLYSTQSGAVPSSSVLYEGELAINLADGKIYTKSGSAILVLNDTTEFLSSSQQITSLIDGSTITPQVVSASILNTSQINVSAGSSDVHISSSTVSGIFDETRTINPPISTAQFSGATIDYTAQRTDDSRSGTLIASWSGSSISYTDISSTDIGTAYDLSFNFVKVNDEIRLRAYSVGSGSGGWSVQFLFKLFPKLV